MLQSTCGRIFYCTSRLLLSAQSPLVVNIIVTEQTHGLAEIMYLISSVWAPLTTEVLYSIFVSPWVFLM